MEISSIHSSPVTSRRPQISHPSKSAGASNENEMVFQSKSPLRSNGLENSFHLPDRFPTSMSRTPCQYARGFEMFFPLIFALNV